MGRGRALIFGLAVTLASGCAKHAAASYPAGALVGKQVYVTAPPDFDIFDEAAKQGDRIVLMPESGHEFLCIYDKVSFIRKSRAKSIVEGWFDRRSDKAASVKPVTEQELTNGTLYTYSYSTVLKGDAANYVSGLLVLPGGRALTIYGATYVTKKSLIFPQWESILETAGAVY